MVNLRRCFLKHGNVGTDRKIMSPATLCPCAVHDDLTIFFTNFSVSAASSGDLVLCLGFSTRA